MSRQIAILFFWIVLVGCAAHATDLSKPHHTENGFQNLEPIQEKSFLDFLQWRWERFGKKADQEDLSALTLKDEEKFAPNPKTAGLSVTWIGHATALIQIENKNILTDPIFSDRASPVTFAGPKRLTPVGLSLESLPQIDLVVISHNHYDSLDVKSILQLRKRPGGNQTVFVVPLGLRRWFKDLQVENVIEMDWWEKQRIQDLDVIGVPTQHWSKRRLWGDQNRSLWSGWVIQGKKFNAYFAGDTGYSAVFKEIGKQFGPFDVSLIPIGAYEPRWFMKTFHVNPEEAVQIHLDVQSKMSIGIHWGTFRLTDEPILEPPLKLAQELAKRKTQKPFITLRLGETLEIPQTLVKTTQTGF